MNSPGLGLLDICRHHFAADFHSARPVFEVIITELTQRNPSQVLHTYTAKLLSTCTGSNLTAATRLLLQDEAPPPNLLEHCLEGRDSSLRLDVIFRLRKMGGVYFDLEIEEYILTREQLAVQLQMAAAYRRETGRGWSLYPSLLEQWTSPEEQQLILFSAAASQWKELTGLLVNLNLPPVEKCLALAWLGHSSDLETLSRMSRDKGSTEQRLQFLMTVKQSMDLIQSMDPSRQPSEDLALALLQDLLDEQFLPDYWWPLISQIADMTPALTLVDPVKRLLPEQAHPWLTSLRARATERAWRFPTAEELEIMPVWAIQGMLNNAMVHPPTGNCDSLTVLMRKKETNAEIFNGLMKLFEVRNDIRPSTELLQIFKKILLTDQCPSRIPESIGTGCARLQEIGEFTSAECRSIYRLFQS